MVHLADTKEQARKDIGFGFKKWVNYSRDVLPASPFPTDAKDPLIWGINNKLLLIGTPEDAIMEIE